MFSRLCTYKILLLSLLAVSTAWATSEHGLRPELSSEKPIEFDQEAQTLTARVDARLVHGDILFEADEIQWQQRTNQVVANGDLTLTDKKFRLVADHINYHLPTRQFEVGSFRLGQMPIYVIGSSLQGSPDVITLWSDKLYLNEPDPFSLNITSHSMEFYPNDRVQMRHAVFRIGKVPFFYLPYYQQKLQEKSAVQFSGELGYRGNLGAYVKTNTLFPLNESLKVGANLDYYTERGVLIGPALEYDITLAPGHTMYGELDSGYINDTGDKEEDILGNSVPEDRVFIEWKHKQQVGEWVDITALLSYWSDSEVERDFRPELFSDNQQPDTFLEAVHTGDNYFASVFGRFRPNNFQSVNERLPEVRFDYVPSPLGKTGFYERFQAAYAHLKEKPIEGGPELRSDRFNAYYQLLRPIRAKDWLTLTPSIGTQVTHYGDAIGSQYTRFLGQIGFDAEMTAYSMWDYQNRIWEIDGLRHTIRPIFNYRYIPEADQGQARIPQVDDEAFSTTLPLIDLGDIRNIDDLHEMHLIRLGIENLLQTRHTDYGSRQLASLDLYQDIRFSRERGEKTFSDLYTDFELSPVHWFSFNLFNRFSPEELTSNETRTSFAINDGDIWSLTLTTDNLQREIDQYSLEFDYKLAERWLFHSQWRYDTRLSSFTRQSYGLTTYVGYSWEAGFEVALHEGTSREGQAEVNFSLRLLTP